MSKPIRPEDVGAAQAQYIPDQVFDIFNSEIAARFDHGSARVKQDTVLKRLVDLGHQRHKVFELGWLNIEQAYKDAGWSVRYEKPGFNESGDAYFEFVATPNRS